MNQRMTETRRRLSRLGYRIRLTQRGHLRIEHVALTWVFFFTSGTPSDYRVLANLKATLRRMGGPA